MKFKAPIEVESSLVDSSNSSGSAGQVLTSTGVGVDWIDPTLLPAESAEKVIQTVRFGEAVLKGDPLVITGYHGSNGPAIVERADATDATKMPAYGVALEDYANNATGLMIAVGDFDDFDTSSYSVGDTLYVAVGGGMTNVKPTGTALIQNMGIVSRSNANNGAAEIVAVGRTNDVPNLPTGRLFVGTATNTSLASDVVYVNDALDRVGIGTTGPNATLDVYGNLHLGTTGDFNITQSPFSTTQFYVTGGGNGGTITFGAPASNTQNVSVQGDLYSYQGSIGTKQFGSFNNKISYNGDNYLNSGNLGIGTTSPSTVLEVSSSGVNGVDISQSASNASQSGRLFFTTNTASEGFVLFNANGTFQVNSGGIPNDTSGTNRISIIGSSGSVGIGTTSPGSKLQVDGEIDANGGDGYRIEGRAWAFWGSDLLTLGDWDGEGYATRIMGSNSSEVMRVTGNNVGIGTTSPQEKLHVMEEAPGNTLLEVENTRNNSTAGVKLSSGQTNFNTAYTNANGDFQIYNSASNRIQFHIGANGRVGIDTTSPSEKLQVSGNVKANNYINQRVAWNSGFNHGSNNAASYYFIPVGYIAESTADTYYNNWIAPYAGRVRKIVIRNTGTSTVPTATTVNFRVSVNGSVVHTGSTITVTGSGLNILASETLSDSTAVFSATDRVQVAYRTNGFWRNAAAGISLEYTE